MPSRERAKRSDWARCTLLPLLFLPRARCARSLSACILSSLASQAFVGFVIIPIIGNAAEHSTAIVMAAKGKMDLAFGVALGSSTQIALFVIPFMVLVAWGMDKPLDLFFGSFETAIIFMAALIVSHVVADGESNWLEGVMLLVAYCIICFAFFFYTPDEAPLSASPGVE